VRITFPIKHSDSVAVVENVFFDEVTLWPLLVTRTPPLTTLTPTNKNIPQHPHTDAKGLRCSCVEAVPSPQQQGCQLLRGFVEGNRSHLARYLRTTLHQTPCVQHPFMAVGSRALPNSRPGSGDLAELNMHNPYYALPFTLPRYL